MSEATRRPLSETQNRKRLPTVFGEPTHAALVRSLVRDPKTGLMMPKNPSPRWIGHGQQIAARDFALAEKSRLYYGGGTMTRQQARRAGLKERKLEAKVAREREAAEALAAMRGSDATKRLRELAALKEQRRRESQAKRSRNRPFKHLHRAARERAILSGAA